MSRDTTVIPFRQPDAIRPVGQWIGNAGDPLLPQLAGQAGLWRLLPPVRPDINTLPAALADGTSVSAG